MNPTHFAQTLHRAHSSGAIGFGRRAILAAMGVTGLLLAACDPSPHDLQNDAVRERLVGHWLRDYQEGEAHVRRLLVLQADGSFQETVRSVGKAGEVSELENAGVWLFDGTNLKRRYEWLDGKRISRLTTPYVTFELHFDSARAFTGLDHVYKRTVHYVKVNDATVL